MKTYLIDGNNVIHAENNWEKIFFEDPERAKNLFVQKVVDHFRNKNNKAIIFFDGFNFVHSHSKVSKNVEVKHAKNKTADETIIITIEKSKNKKNLIVVSNDLGVIKKSKLLLCTHKSSEDFIKELNRSYFKSYGSEKPDPTNEEKEFWIKIFNQKNDEEL